MHHVKDDTGRIKAASSSISPQNKGGASLIARRASCIR